MIPGVIADKFGALNVIVPINWSLIVVAWSWLAVKSVSGLYVWTVFYGFNVAGLQCLIPPVTALLTPDMRFIGTRLGMVFATMGFAGLSGPPIGGAIQAAMNGRFLGAQIWSAACSMVCAVVLTAAMIAKRRADARKAGAQEEGAEAEAQNADGD